MKLETERLILRPFEDRDVDAYSAINADPEVMRYFPAPYSRLETIKTIARCNEALAARGFSFLAAELKATGELAGTIGLGLFDQISRDAIPGHPEVEVGWRLAHSLWGQGLAPEGARAWLDYAWSVLGLSEVVAITVEDNQPSRRVMEKLGMRYDPAGDFDHPKVDPLSGLQRHVLYRIDNPSR
jgi:RimJ/RimL family protein N-acetyltransferase